MAHSVCIDVIFPASSSLTLNTRSDNFKDLRCMGFTSKGQSEILVAGYQDKMFVVDVNKGEITKEVWAGARDYERRDLY